VWVPGSQPPLEEKAMVHAGRLRAGPGLTKMLSLQIGVTGRARREAVRGSWAV
jgi:hypothetical protein